MSAVGYERTFVKLRHYPNMNPIFEHIPHLTHTEHLYLVLTRTLVYLVRAQAQSMNPTGTPAIFDAYGLGLALCFFGWPLQACPLSINPVF